MDIRRFVENVLGLHIIQTGQTPGSNIFRRRHSISPLKPRGYIFVQLRYISTPCNTNLFHFIT